MSEQETISRLCSSYFRLDSPIPYQIDADGDNIYMRWATSDTELVFIRKVNTTGNITTNTFTRALWANRATATYYFNLDNQE